MKDNNNIGVIPHVILLNSSSKTCLCLDDYLAVQNKVVLCIFVVVVLGASVIAHNKMRAWEASAGTLMMSK